MADCYLCGKRAVFRTEAGPLCAGHFSKWYEDGVANAISRYSMVNPGEFFRRKGQYCASCGSLPFESRC